MRPLAALPHDILRFLKHRSFAGEACVLVTLTGIEGSSPRTIGAQMAVSETGEYAGSLSGGCIEAAVVSEALEVLLTDKQRIVRYGRGSPYLDVRLPCGGGIDLLFTPRPDSNEIAAALARLDNRTAAALSLRSDGVRLSDTRAPFGWQDGAFIQHYVPPVRLVAFGQGEELSALARVAAASGALTSVFSPYVRDLDALGALGVETALLPYLNWRPNVAGDMWTAFIFLFHDRDWEEALLPWALQQASLYCGALGSRRANAERTIMLEKQGIAAEAISTLRSPVGLIPSTRDPSTLAISILAEVFHQYATNAFIMFANAEETSLRDNKDRSVLPGRAGLAPDDML